MSCLHAVEPSHVWQEHGHAGFEGSSPEKGQTCACVCRGKRARNILKVRRLGVEESTFFFLSLFGFSPSRHSSPRPSSRRPWGSDIQGILLLKMAANSMRPVPSGSLWAVWFSGAADWMPIDAVKATRRICESQTIWMFNQNWSQLDAPVLP